MHIVYCELIQLEKIFDYVEPFLWTKKNVKFLMRQLKSSSSLNKKYCLLKYDN
jgi:hypothetical protein